MFAILLSKLNSVAVPLLSAINTVVWEEDSLYTINKATNIRQPTAMKHGRIINWHVIRVVVNKTFCSLNDGSTVLEIASDICS